MTCPPLDLNVTSRCGASQYVQDVAIPNWLKIQGCVSSITTQISGYKASVKVVAASNIPLSGLSQYIDGVAVDTDGDRVLLISQANPLQNGIWIAHSGNWSRPEDFLPTTHAAASFVIVEEGAVYADTAWICSTDKPADLVDLDPLAWMQFMGGGSVVAGLGLYATPGALNVGANADGSIIVNANDIQVGVINDIQHGNRGGGSLHALVTILTAGFMSAADKIKLDGITPGAGVPSARTLTAGAGLTGGGDLSADRTFNVGANADGSILVNVDDIQVGVLATDAQHGNRGGGTLHALVTILVPGFMSAADKIKLDGIAPGATATPLAVLAPANVTKAAAVVGVGVTAARDDHKHDIDTAAPVDVGTANVEGAATSLARSNHVHNHGNLPGGALHAIVTAVAPGFTPTLPADSSLYLDGIGHWSTPIPTAGNFGRDFQSAASEGESSTTSNVWQDKLTMTTPAMTGTYRLGFYFELKSNGSNKDAQGRCYNVTDAAEVGFDETPTRPANSFMVVTGFQEIVFTGAAKTFKIQWNFNDVTGTATIRRARLELWRVS